MGNNQAFTDFENIVVELYDRDREMMRKYNLAESFLSPKLLDLIAISFRGSDIDIGGLQNFCSEDDLSVVEICLKVFGTLPERPEPSHPYRSGECFHWGNRPRNKAERAYDRKVYTRFKKLWKRWGW